jgi:hypothetical protein
MNRVLFTPPALLLTLSLGCASSSRDAEPPLDGSPGVEASAEAPAAEVPVPVAAAGCADLPATATCRLSGPYELTYDQITTQSTADPTGFSCRQVVGMPRVVFSARDNRLCAADVDELTVSADGCTVDLTQRYRTDGGSEYWVNETKLHLTFAPQDGGALAGQGTARLEVSGFHICTKTATVTARAP